MRSSNKMMLSTIAVLGLLLIATAPSVSALGKFGYSSVSAGTSGLYGGGYGGGLYGGAGCCGGYGTSSVITDCQTTCSGVQTTLVPYHKPFTFTTDTPCPPYGGYGYGSAFGRFGHSRFGGGLGGFGFSRTAINVR